MQLSTLDWIIIACFFAISLGIGIYASRRSGKNFTEYFLSGGNMPWWLLGVSMVATTFAADTPNLVTNIVREDGVSGNWVWWAFLLTGMLTVFVYAKLWKRSGILTDLEFYELRYSGKAASFLRGFRAIYLGVIFNCIIMATVMLAGVKIGGVLLGIKPWHIIILASVITLIYTLLGGLRGVILTDFFQFAIALGGAIAAAIYILDLPEVGSLNNLLTHPNLEGKLNFLPDLHDPSVYIPLLIIPLAVQWWASWYPGAEPGGGGYIAQRMLSSKNESHAVGATLFFNIAHYALRPWPWIIVGLASLIVFPDLETLRNSFPDLDPGIIDHDLAYPAMLSYLPAGLLGIVIASLIAALMSTISTHLNWGASYLSNDFYRRFINPAATDRQLVSTGRWFTLGLMVVSGVLAMGLDSALDAFFIILQIGAGTGLIYILRWFWWRINAFSEIAAMVISFAVASFFQFAYPYTGLPDLEPWMKLCWGVGITTAGWFVVTFLTKPTETRVLQAFYKHIRPDSLGWKPVIHSMAAEDRPARVAPAGSTISNGVVAMFLATFMVYAILFGTGYLIYGIYLHFILALGIAVLCATGLWRIWPSLKMDTGL